MKILTYLLLLPFKIILFLFSGETDYNKGDKTYKKTKFEYKPVGENGELIQVPKSR